MKLPELRSRLSKFLAYDLDNFEGESPANSALDSQINYALRLMSREMFMVDPMVVFRPEAGRMVYNYQMAKYVSRRVVRPLTVTIAGVKLWDRAQRKHGVWNMEELHSDHPTWETAASGAPTKAVLFGSRQMILHLPPTQAVVDAGSHFICGQVLCDDLTGVYPLDDPGNQGFPVEFHDGIAYLASVFAADPSVTEQEGFSRLARYDKSWKDFCKAARNENYRLYHSGGSVRSEYDGYISLGR